MALPRFIDVIEGDLIQQPVEISYRLRRRVLELQRELRASLPFIREDINGLRIFNLIGAVDIGGGITFNIRPKTNPGERWLRSVLYLLFGEERIEASDGRVGDFSAERLDLIDAIAAIYARRVARALRRDGPLMIMEAAGERLPILRGRLDVGKWLAGRFQHPTTFPVSYSRLTHDNDFSRALAWVCRHLAMRIRGVALKAELLNLAAELRAGCPPNASPAVGVELRTVPPQWSAYQPAWVVAQAILTRRALLGPQGERHGLSIAIEGWPLLERLLLLSLEGAVAQGSSQGRQLATPDKILHQLLHPVSQGGATRHLVEPDGLLLEDGRVAASFEAKYRRFDPDRGPLREEIYQALAAARAVGSPMSILVYPNSFAPRIWSVKGGGAPAHLAALGLDLFSFERGGAEVRGGDILSLIADATALRSGANTAILSV